MNMVNSCTIKIVSIGSAFSCTFIHCNKMVNFHKPKQTTCDPCLGFNT